MIRSTPSAAMNPTGQRAERKQRSTFVLISIKRSMARAPRKPRAARRVVNPAACTRLAAAFRALARYPT
jgi:hypothetical protein